jgi:hypothetical protein
MFTLYDAEHERLSRQYIRELKRSIKAGDSSFDHRVFIAKQRLVAKERMLLDTMATKNRQLVEQLNVLVALCRARKLGTEAENVLRLHSDNESKCNARLIRKV